MCATLRTPRFTGDYSTQIAHFSNITSGFICLYNTGHYWAPGNGGFRPAHIGTSTAALCATQSPSPVAALVSYE